MAGIEHTNVYKSHARNENWTAPSHIPAAGRGPTNTDTSNMFSIITLRYFTTTGCNMVLTLSTDHFSKLHLQGELMDDRYHTK